jgi:hypothetical protein
MGTLLDVQSWIVDRSIEASLAPAELAFKSMVDPVGANRVPTDWRDGLIFFIPF